jgi:hypothetical protein
MILKARAILLNDITADIEPNRSATESKNYTSLWTEELSRRVWHIELRAFFPSNAFMASARSFNTFNCMLQK